ncbi:MAG: hypothetical protein EON98_15175 [Chitinophagaceae bacterium]|nr:MAG: hypothetical protein EON98_15175 [Chitinophagaceae bacterium]
MRDYIFFFIMFTLLEIAVSVIYYCLVKTIDARMVIGSAIYACGMISAYSAYRHERYLKQRQEMIDGLL